MTRVRATTYALSAAALLVGLAAPAASASTQNTQHAQKPGHARSQRIPFTAATVTATGRTGTYRISWTAPGVGHVKIKANGRTVASGGPKGSVKVTGLPENADRQWFDLVPDRGQGLRLADRQVALEGAVNFRDAGGYRTAGGQWVKMGEIYRSDALNNLTDADVAKLKRLHIDVDYDLRTEAERSAAPDRVPAGTRYVVADVLGGGSATVPAFGSEAEAVQMMVDGEKAMVSADTAKAAYTSVYGGIVDGDSALFHCSAGKDRTGWANAALLTMLGVDRETVMKDYLASNDYRAEANAAALAAMPADQAKVYKPLLDVRAEYLNSGFEEVRARYGTFTNYEKKALDLNAKDIRTLRSELLVG